MNLEKTFQDFRYGIRGQKGASTEDTMKACLAAASRGKNGKFHLVPLIQFSLYLIVCKLYINAQLVQTFFRFLPALLTRVFLWQVVKLLFDFDFDCNTLLYIA